MSLSRFASSRFDMSLHYNYTRIASTKKGAAPFWGAAPDRWGDRLEQNSIIDTTIDTPRQTPGSTPQRCAIIRNDNASSNGDETIPGSSIDSAISTRCRSTANDSR